MMMLRNIHWLMLRNLIERNGANLTKVSEQYRQILIDLSMHEPPFVDVDGETAFATDAGRDALTKRPKI